jgi:hypothetical protein
MRKRTIGLLRGRLTYANVAATLALVLAMSGGALAASHYLINSTKQINPKVLKKLRGARGALGPTGGVGPQGIQGPEGKRGSRGEPGVPGFSALSLLPKGSSESGEFSVSLPSVAEGAIVEGTATFPIPLTTPIEKQVEVTPVAKPATNCLGPGLAARGWLCIYTRTKVNTEFQRAFDPESFEEVEPPGRSGRFGFGMKWKAEKEGEVEVAGTWTVTAP